MGLSLKEAIAALQEYRSLYTNLVEKTSDLITRVNPDGRFVYVNHSAQEIFGIPAEECIGRFAFEFVSPEDRERTVAAFNSWVQSDLESFEFENRQIGVDGRTHILTWVICAERNAEGKITGFISTGRDITDSKNTEMELLKSEALTSAALDNFPLIFYMIDKEGVFRLSVGAGLKGLGLEQNQVVGLSAFAIYKDFPEIIKALQMALAGKRATFETTVAGASYFNVCIPFTPADGWFSGMIGVALDISDRIRTGEVLQNVQKLESLGILAGGIAHDFNNLVGGILGYIDLAKDCSKDKEVGDYLEKALGAINRAQALTMQLLTFAKGGDPVRKVGVLAPVLQEAALFSLSGSNVSCSFDIQDELYQCNFDKNQLCQVIDNIIINAQHAMPDGGTIELVARNITLQDQEHLLLTKGNYVRISIHDHGTGIPAEQLLRIFDPFFTTKEKGHGLGLATCYSIIKRHGGVIDVESQFGSGSTFHIYLPATDAKEIEEVVVSKTIHSGSGLIIVMDDEEVMREVISDMLSAIGYTVLCTKNGKETVDLFMAESRAQHPVAGIILDLTIPGGMGGRETNAEIRKIDTTVPVFVSSGYADDPVMQEPHKYGFTASIYKPFLKDTLMAMLSRYLTIGQ